MAMGPLSICRGQSFALDHTAERRVFFRPLGITSKTVLPAGMLPVYLRLDISRTDDL